MKCKYCNNDTFDPIEICGVCQLTAATSGSKMSYNPDKLRIQYLEDVLRNLIDKIERQTVNGRPSTSIGVRAAIIDAKKVLNEEPLI